MPKIGPFLVPFFAACLSPCAASAAGSISITIVDAQSGARLDGARAVLTDAGYRELANAGGGRFVLAGVPAGRHRVTATAAAHRDAWVEVVVSDDAEAAATLKLSPLGEAQQLRVIGRAASRSEADLSEGLALHTTIGTSALIDAGIFRFADALDELPSVNATATGHTSLSNGPGASIYLDMRGLGSIETQTLIDGHPIGQGIDLGYNYQDAPIFGFRDVFVGYGTGASGLLSIGSVGGVVDMRTLEATQRASESFLQGIGSYGRLTTAFRATGKSTNGRIGYAVAYGVDGTGGPLGSQVIYSPAASWDPSSKAHSIVDPATYPLSQSTIRRAALGRVTFSLGGPTQLSLRAISNTSYADGTGNSDDIFLPYPVALAEGRRFLSAKPPTDPCPSGTFTAANLFGAPNGFGRNGAPDGGVTCQTPKQYASFNTGWQGFGPHFTEERATDYDARLSTTYGKAVVTLDAFTNSYHFYYDRLQFQPYAVKPGDTGFSLDQLVVNSGGSALARLQAGDHDLGAGLRLLGNTNRFATTGSPLSAPATAETAFTLEDVWHRPGSRLELQGSGALVHSTATHTTTVDPHAALLYDLGPRDRLRLTAGVATVEPPGAWLDAPFVPTRMFSATCTQPASIGNVSSATLRPERGADRDVTYSHRWGDGAETVVAAYDVDLTNKIENATIPLGQLPPGAYDPSVVPFYQQQLEKACGAKNQGLGATGFVNLARIHARGIEIVGHAPLVHGFGVDYAWSQESAILGAASAGTLQSNPTLIPSGQLPNVPLHKATLGLWYRHAQDLSAQITGNWVSANNPSNLPAYWYANFNAAGRVGPGRLHVVLNNVFNQMAGDRNYVGLGVPVPLNAYAPPGAAASFIGASTQYEYLLAPRNVDVFYEIRR